MLASSTSDWETVPLAGTCAVDSRRQAAAHVKTIHMSWSKDGGRSGPRGYHHGNLKEALLRAALDLIAKKGPAGFTFAEAARWAGVSPAAPYRHFRDRDELLSSVALRGFEQFEDGAGESLGRWPSRSVHGVRPARQGLSRVRAHRACLSTRRCSRLAFRWIPVRNCARPATARSRVLRTAAERLAATLPAQHVRRQ